MFTRFLLRCLLRLTVFRRPPDLTIGDQSDPYMRRWWVIPRNKLFNIYFHQILRDDSDVALHDHPWVNCSIVLSGGYFEHGPAGRKFRRPGSVTLRRASSPHRLTLPTTGMVDVLRIPAWTIFITGPVVREWGFHCPKGWRHWKEVVTVREKGNQTGRGCA